MSLALIFNIQKAALSQLSKQWIINYIVKQRPNEHLFHQITDLRKKQCKYKKLTLEAHVK